jgi:CRISPR/Cas system-associated endonuclease Cas1
MKNALLITGANIALTLALIAANTPAGAPVCFYPSSAKYNGQYYTFVTTNPTEKMYLQVKGTKRGIITRADGGYNNAFLNKLFPSMTK